MLLQTVVTKKLYMIQMVFCVGLKPILENMENTSYDLMEMVFILPMMRGIMLEKPLE